MALEFSQGSVTPQSLKITDELFPDMMAQYRGGVRDAFTEAFEKTGMPPDFQTLQDYASLNYTTATPMEVAMALQAVFKGMEAGQQQPQQGGQNAKGLRKIANTGVTPVTASMEA